MPSLPIERLQVRTQKLVRMTRCMAEMRGIPENDVPVLDDLAVHEPVDVRAGQCRVRGEALTVVDLRRSVIPKRPEVTYTVGVSRAVVRAGNESVAFVRL